MAYVPPADYYIGKWVNMRPQAQAVSLTLQISPQQDPSQAWVEQWSIDFRERAVERKWTQSQSESIRLVDLKGLIQFYVIGLFSPSSPTLRNLILSFDLGPKETDLSRLIRIHRQPLIAVGEGNELYFEQDQTRFFGVRLSNQSLIRQDLSTWLIEVPDETAGTLSFLIKTVSGPTSALPTELTDSVQIHQQRWDDLVR